MHVINRTPFEVGYAPGFIKDGRNILVIVIKATYQLPKSDEEAQIAQSQTPVVHADVLTSENDLAAVLYEADTSPFKPCCDVLLNGSAHAPQNVPVDKIEVGLQLDDQINKRFLVLGDRLWPKGRLFYQPSPEFFTQQLISYDHAFGGSDFTQPDNPKFYAKNLVGRGFTHYNPYPDNLLMPNTEEINHPVTDPKGKYHPMAFGATGRAWPERAQYAGTYDEKWIKEQMPFPPEDLDERFFQAAPKEQQCAYLQGGETVTLTNLSKYASTLSFKIPRQAPKLIVTWHQKEDLLFHPVVDTLIIEPDLNRFIMVSRVMVPLPQSIFDVKELIIGDVTREWYHKQRAPNKKYYRDLSDFMKQ